MTRIHGFCPCCANASLVLDDSALQPMGRKPKHAMVKCSLPDCPEPYAAHSLLMEVKPVEAV